MTPKQLAAARDGLGTASQAATDMWGRIVGDSPEDDDRRTAGAALAAVSQHVGAETDVDNWTLEEAVYRTAKYLDRSAALLGFHGTMGEMSIPEADPRVGGYSALRRCGAMNLLAPFRVLRAGLIGGSDDD